MELLLITALGLLALALALRLRRLHRAVADLTEAVHARRLILLEIPREPRRSGQLDRLGALLRELLDENLRLTRQQQGTVRKIEATLGALKEAVLFLDDEQRLLMANSPARELLTPPTDLVTPLGQRLETLLRSAAILEYIQRLRTGLPAPRAEVSLPRRNETAWFEITGTTVAGSDETESPGLLLVLHDITRLKQLEALRKDFVANVSHELRTPVTIIKGFADTIAEDDARLAPEDRARFLEKIRRNANRLHLLLADLLQLSRLESAQETLNPAPGVLHKTLRDTAEDFAPRLAQAGVTLHLQLAPPADDAPADPLKLGQVLQNLFENALRHARGLTHLTITTALTPDGLTRLTVEDNGCGVPPRHVPHLFERFYRVDKSRSRENGGTGLGLSIVKHIVQLHGGHVHAESTEGHGTRIHLYLPRPAHTPPPQT